MGDEKDSTTRSRTGRVSRTHPVLGDSSPEARASRLKTEVVPPSMMGRLRDQLLSGDTEGFTHPPPFEESPNPSKEKEVASVQPTPPPKSGAVVPPPAEPEPYPDPTSSDDQLLAATEELLPDTGQLSSPLTAPKSKAILVDRRQAQQGRETIRQLREARSKRHGGSTGPAPRRAFFGRTWRDGRLQKLVVIAGGLFGGVAILSTLFSSRPAPVVMPPPPSSSVSEKPQLLPGSIFEPVSGPLAFPRLPSGLYIGVAKGILPERDVSLTFISHNNGDQLGVVLGLDGWLAPVISPPPEETVITVNSSGWRIRFIMKRASDDLIVGRWENTFTKEVGEWKVAPLR